MNIQFGSGVLYSVPVGGNQAANPTPYKYGVLQEATVDFKADLKKLFGQNQFAVATARGKVEVSLKAKLAVFDVGLFNQMYFGQTQAAGVARIADDEIVAVNASTNVATTTHAADFDTDYGVRDATTGQQLERVTSSPVSGQYSVNVDTGLYTVPGYGGENVLISYTYTDNATGSTISLDSKLMGYAPEIRAFLYNQFRNKYLAIELYDVTLGTVSVPTKLEDFWVCDIDGSANANAAGQLGRLMADLV